MHPMGFENDDNFVSSLYCFRMVNSYIINYCYQFSKGLL